MTAQRILFATLATAELFAAAYPGHANAQDMASGLVAIESARDQACASGDADLCRMATDNVAMFRRLLGNDAGQRAPTAREELPERSYRSTSTFGSLPYGIGTGPQRAFWQSRCEGRADDGSPAAQGCRQTLATLTGNGSMTGGQRSAAARNMYSPPTTTTTTATGGRSMPTPPLLATRVSCVTMRPERTKSLGFWEVVNACPYKVIGTFKYNDGYSGGFGPLGSGKVETISPPSKRVTSYTVEACVYEEWTKGICK